VSLYKATIFLKHGLEPIVLPEIPERRANFLYNINLGAKTRTQLSVSETDPRAFNIDQEAIVYIVIEVLP